LVKFEVTKTTTKAAIEAKATKASWRGFIDNEIQSVSAFDIKPAIALFPILAVLPAAHRDVDLPGVRARAYLQRASTKWLISSNTVGFTEWPPQVLPVVD
jgi:hypothetical protein